MLQDDISRMERYNKIQRLNSDMRYHERAPDRECNSISGAFIALVYLVSWAVVVFLIITTLGLLFKFVNSYKVPTFTPDTETIQTEKGRLI